MNREEIRAFVCTLQRHSLSTLWMRYTSDLTDAEWSFIDYCFPKPSSTGRPREHSYRELVNAVFYLVKTACQWRNLPESFAPWPTVYHYFRQWNRGWTGRAEKNNIKPVLGLTHQVVQKSEPGHLNRVRKIVDSVADAIDSLKQVRDSINKSDEPKPTKSLDELVDAFSSLREVIKA